MVLKISELDTERKVSVKQTFLLKEVFWEATKEVVISYSTEIATEMKVSVKWTSTLKEVFWKSANEVVISNNTKCTAQKI